MKLRIILLSVLLSTPILVHAQQKNSKCAKIFEHAFQRISNDKLVAFEVNSDYLLEPQFKKNCKLVRIDVEPKSYSKNMNPDQEETDSELGLSEGEYTQLLARINAITSLGALMYKVKYVQC